MKKVITYGTFDVFHFGHLQLLRRAKAMGDYLIVAISTDEFNLREKNKQCVFPFKHRAEIVRSIKYVDEVIPEENWEQKVYDVEKYGIDVFVIGEDWKGKFDFLKGHCQVVYLSRTRDISTTEIKDAIKRGNFDLIRQIGDY